MNISSRKQKAKQGLTFKQIRQVRNQITSPDELKIGETYLAYAGGIISKIIITKLYSPKPGWFRAFYLEGREGSSDTFSMADYGIIPYPQGGWNLYNYLVPSEKEQIKV